MVIAKLHRPFQVFAHARAFREDAGQQEGEEDGEPAVDRKAGIEMDRVRRSLRRSRSCDGARRRR